MDTLFEFSEQILVSVPFTPIVSQQSRSLRSYGLTQLIEFHALSHVRQGTSNKKKEEHVLMLETVCYANASINGGHIPARNDMKK